MGRVNEIAGQGFAARLVLFKADAQDGAPIGAAAFDGERVRIAPGVFEYRKEGGRVFVVWKVAAATANGTRYVLAVVYAPAPTRDTQSVFTALVADIGVDVVKSWAVVLNADGTLRVPALDSDVTTIGTAVKNSLWPAAWRVRLVTDVAPIGQPPPAPTGARCIAEVMA